MDKFEILIPDYLRQFTVSKSRRPIYFELTEDGIKSTSGNRKVPKKIGVDLPSQKAFTWAKGKGIKYKLGLFVGSELKSTYWTQTFFPDIEYRSIIHSAKNHLTAAQVKRAKIFIIDATTEERYIANSKSVGTPKLMTINGQLLYSGMHEHTRAKMMTEIKKSFMPFAAIIPKIPFDHFTVRCTIYDTVANELSAATTDWDIGNRAMPYRKAMLDLLTTGHCGDGNLVMEPRIVSDDRRVVTGEFDRFHPIEDGYEIEANSTLFKMIKDSGKEYKFLGYSYHMAGKHNVVGTLNRIKVKNLLQFEFIEDKRPCTALLKRTNESINNSNPIFDITQITK